MSFGFTSGAIAGLRRVETDEAYVWPAVVQADCVTVDNADGYVRVCDRVAGLEIDRLYEARPRLNSYDGDSDAKHSQTGHVAGGGLRR
jgi:hypothetical protein